MAWGATYSLNPDFYQDQDEENKETLMSNNNDCELPIFISIMSLCEIVICDTLLGPGSGLVWSWAGSCDHVRESVSGCGTRSQSQDAAPCGLSGLSQCPGLTFYTAFPVLYL